MVKIHENKGENAKVKMQSLEEAVPCPELKSKCFQDLKDNSLDSSIQSTRMYKELPQCFVVLHRLTEEDLHKSYPSDSENDYNAKHNADRGVGKFCKRISMYASKGKDGSWRRVRKPSKATDSAFESFRKTREKFLSRKNRAYYSENSFDMSQDESRTSDNTKTKKKLKRGHTYERDFEWRPDGTLNSDRKLRMHHTSMIESDSSSSVEDDYMYDEYYYCTDANEGTDSSNAVPSENAISAANTKNSKLENQSSSDINTFSHHNANAPVSSLQKPDSVLCDLVSDIIKGMDKQHPNSNKLKTSVNTLPCDNTNKSNDFKRTEQKKRKRRRILSEDELSKRERNKIVAKILKETVNKVSSKLKKLENESSKPKKKCKWCNTEFLPNRSSDIKCVICTDLKCDEPTNKKPSNSGKIKQVKENKVKKPNSAKVRFLKNLSEPEKQRLLYSEKSSDKTKLSKGYNHLKSFDTVKNVNNSSPVIAKHSSQKKIQNKLSLKGNKISTSSDPKNNQTNANVSNSKSDKTPIPKIKINSQISESKQNKNCGVSLENYKEGLFLMTFPDPDEEIDFDGKLSQSQTTTSGTNSNNAGNFNSKQSPTTESLLSSMKQSQSVSTKKYDTYLFPPIPTVIVSNYCSDTSSLNLSHTYFQNEITHQHAIKNSTIVTNTVNSKPVITNRISPNVSHPSNTSSVPISSAIAYQNSLITNNLQSSNSASMPTFPINTNNLSQITVNTIPNLNPEISALTVLPKTSVSPGKLNMIPKTSVSAGGISILPKPSVPTSKVTLLPILTSVVSLSTQNTSQFDKVKEVVPSSFSADNFVNSQLLDIEIDNVTSLKNFETHNQSSLNSDSITNKDVNKCLPADLGNPISAENRSHSSVKRMKLNSDRCPSDYSDISHQQNTSKNSSDISKDNSVNNSQFSNLHKGNLPNRLNNNDPPEQQQLSSKQADKSSAVKENAVPVSATQSAIDVLGAISILAVIDLEKNPQTGLNVRIQLTKNQLSKLTSEKISTPEHNERVASCQYNLQLLNIAKRYLILYGSFTKVSEHLLRKANMIQIKKELHEEETNQSSCMFSQSSHSLSEKQLDVPRTEMSPANNQIQNFTSPKPNLPAAMSHIEKLKSQIAAMNNLNVNVDLSQYGGFPGYNTVHHFPGEQITALNPAVAAPTPVTPRNDCLANESRETPSRGSGPRTPARPESAASQSEDTTLIQVKKEQFEAIASPSTQCAYAQNTALPQISSHLPVMSDISTFNMPQQSIVNTSVHLPINNTNLVYSNQANYNVHPGNIAPNRTVTYNSHQNYPDMYLNVASKPQLQITPTTPNTEMRQNQQVLLGQQMYIQNGSGLCSKQAVPSVNNNHNNQYVIRPPYTTSNTGGTLIVNNTQVGQNALLTNVSNQQFYTSNPVSQLYYPPSTQMSCMPSNNISTVIPQEIAAAQIQQAELESPEQMICAVCNKQATLRCKQCARVAYCNTACAKTYWHQKHKMECKPLGS